MDGFKPLKVLNSQHKITFVLNFVEICLLVREPRQIDMQLTALGGKLPISRHHISIAIGHLILSSLRMLGVKATSSPPKGKLRLWMSVYGTLTGVKAKKSPPKGKLRLWISVYGMPTGIKAKESSPKGKLRLWMSVYWMPMCEDPD